jgi:hypothetical protein
MGATETNSKYCMVAVLNWFSTSEAAPSHSMSIHMLEVLKVDCSFIHLVDGVSWSTIVRYIYQPGA